MAKPINPSQTSLLEIKQCTHLLGALFYYSPFAPETNAIVQNIEAGKVSEIVNNIPNRRWQEAYQLEGLEPAWQKMFLGTDNFLAPPWGSVYLDRENVVFGDSLLELRKFMYEQGFAFENTKNEPEDHIGLILLLLANLLEEENEPAAKTLLNQHLLTWAFRYLEELSKYSLHPFISELPFYTQNIFKHWVKTYHLEPKELTLYWPNNS